MRQTCRGQCHHESVKTAAEAAAADACLAMRLSCVASSSCFTRSSSRVQHCFVIMDGTDTRRVGDRCTANACSPGSEAARWTFAWWLDFVFLLDSTLLGLAAWSACSASAMCTMMLHSAEATAAELAELMLSIHAWRASTSEYQRGTYTHRCAIQRSTE